MRNCYRLDDDGYNIHRDNCEMVEGAWGRREEQGENYTGNGIALTAEMMVEREAGRENYRGDSNT